MFGSLFRPKGYKNISQQEAKDRLSSPNKPILLDVRTSEEYREIRIPGSKSLPLNRLDSGIEKVTKDKSAEIIVYCLSGARAVTACRRLAAMGYTNVSNMGGIRSWKYETKAGR